VHTLNVAILRLQEITAFPREGTRIFISLARVGLRTRSPRPTSWGDAA
jgi:hypothetical protein